MICQRCMESNMGSCGKGISKTDTQIKNENYKCFKERILKVYDTDETKDAILVEKGVYGDAFTASGIEMELKRLMRLKDSMLIRVGV